MKPRTCASSRSVRKRTHRSGTFRHGRGGKVVLKTNTKNMRIVFPPLVASTTNHVQRAFLETVFRHIQRNENSPGGIADAIVDLCKRESREKMEWVAPEELYQLCVDYAKSMKLEHPSPETQRLEDYMYILDYSYQGFNVLTGKAINNAAHRNEYLSDVFRSGHNRSPPKTLVRNTHIQKPSNRSPFASLNPNLQREHSNGRSSVSSKFHTRKSKGRSQQNRVSDTRKSKGRRQRNNASRTRENPSTKPFRTLSMR